MTGGGQRDRRDSRTDRALHLSWRSNFKLLPLHNYALYELIRVAGEVTASELHERYDNAAEQLFAGSQQTPIEKRSSRNKLTNLREYDMTGHKGHHRTVSIAYVIVS